MPNTKLPHSLENVFTGRPNGGFGLKVGQGVVQDKTALTRGRAASRQPEPHETAARSRPLHTKPPRSLKRHSSKRQTVHVVLWVKPRVKQLLQEKAQAEGLSMSKAGGVLLEHFLQEHKDMQYSPLLKPVIQHEIRESMQVFSNRIAALLVRIAYCSEQTRNLVTTDLNRQPDMTQEMLTTILQESEKTARWSITRTSPQLVALMEALKASLRAGGEEHTPHD